MNDLIHWLFCYFSVGSPSPTFSPVNGFLVVGVVIVLFLVHLLNDFLYLVWIKFAFLSNGISSVDVIGSPSTGPYFVTSSTGGVTTSPVSGFLTPGLPGTSSWLPFGAFGSNSSLWPGLISSPPYSVISSTGCFVIFLLVHFANFFPVNGFLVVGVVIVFVPGSPFERLSLYLALSLDQIRVFIKRNFFR